MSEHEHVVVCDDEPDIRDTLQEYLERRGYAGFFLRQGRAHRVVDFDLSLQDQTKLRGYASREVADYVNNFVFIPVERPVDAVMAACEALLRRDAT